MMRRLLLLVPVPPLFWIWGYEFLLRNHVVTSQRWPVGEKDFTRWVLVCSVCGMLDEPRTSSHHQNDLAEAFESAITAVMPRT
jgi:hypothetical protein